MPFGLMPNWWEQIPGLGQTPMPQTPAPVNRPPQPTVQLPQLTQLPPFLPSVRPPMPFAPPMMRDRLMSAVLGPLMRPNFGMPIIDTQGRQSGVGKGGGFAIPSQGLGKGGGMALPTGALGQIGGMKIPREPRRQDAR